MRKHARSGTNREKFFAAEIGSRIFPFRTPPPSPATMPTVGTRRSTRVFVPKQQSRPSDRAVEDRARVLRSGKRFALEREDDGNEWLKVADLNGWWRFEGRNGWTDEMIVDGKIKNNNNGCNNNKLFGTVYSRKRKRSSSSSSTSAGDVKDRKFGIFFERKHRKKKFQKSGLTKEATELRVRELSVSERSKNFAAKWGILEGELWTGEVERGPLVLTVLVDLSSGYSLDRFQQLLVLVMRWMRRARVGLRQVVELLLRRSIGGVFAYNGVHFLPIRHPNNRILDSNSVGVTGVCKIYGSREFVPLLSVDYSALPLYFKSLHANVIHHSLSLSDAFRSKYVVGLRENPLAICPVEEHVQFDSHLEMFFSQSEVGTPLEMECSRSEVTSSQIPDVKSEELQSVVDSLVSVEVKPVTLNCSKIQKHQKKRSSSRNSRPRTLSSRRSHFGPFYSNMNSPSVPLTPKADLLVSPVIEKQLDSCSSDLLSGREESGNSSSPGSHSMQRRSAWKKSVVDNVRELRLALAEVRQNIDSACCNANILVTESDKCWREDGAHVSLEMSDSHEWCIAVKRREVTRFLHKPQDMRPCVVNRFTHAYMWSSDEGWKLEFWDRWDWHVFKELHTECRDRNLQEVCVKIIPVPGVREVFGYEEDAVPSFVRPSTYINMLEDEVGRALTGENSFYDMDLEDEVWLIHLNSSSLFVEGNFSSISEEDFERIIFTLERFAYNSPGDASDNKERALDLCKGLGQKDVVCAIYEYWFKKRNQRGVPLVRVFQGPPLRRAEFIQKPFLRKKRSFKRQRSQAERNQGEMYSGGRGKPDLVLQAHQIARRKVQEVEAAAFRAIEVATSLRTRAQMLMSNADLLSYKATIALRIADSIFTSSSPSESPKLDSSILFD